MPDKYDEMAREHNATPPSGTPHGHGWTHHACARCDADLAALLRRVAEEEREAATRRFATEFADALDRDGKTYSADCIRRALRGEPPFFEAVAAAIRARKGEGT